MLETATNLKSGRRKSPVPLKRHGERGEKGGAVGGITGPTIGALLSSHHGTILTLVLIVISL